MKRLSPWVLFSKNAGYVCSQHCLSSLPGQAFNTESQVTLSSLEIQSHVLHSQSKPFAFGCWSPHTQQNAGPQQPPSLLAGDVLPFTAGPTMPGELSKDLDLELVVDLPELITQSCRAFLRCSHLLPNSAEAGIRSPLRTPHGAH